MLEYTFHDIFEIKDFIRLTIYVLGVSVVYLIRQLICTTSILSNDHGEQKEEVEYERGPQRNPHSIRGSTSRNLQQNIERYDKSKVQCYYCKKIGQFASKCRKKQVDNKKQSVNLTEENEVNENPVLLTCNVAQQNSNDFLPFRLEFVQLNAYSPI